MTLVRRYNSEEAKVVHLCQMFEPTLMREYFMWSAVWRHDPQNGRGPLPSPIGKSLERGADIFWEVLEAEEGFVQAFQASAVRVHLEAALEDEA